MLDLKHKLLIGGIIAAFAATGVAFASWLSAHDAATKAEATVAAQKEAFDKAGAQMKTLADADEARTRRTEDALDSIRATAARAVTPQEIAKYLQQTIPVQPGAAPITVNVPPATPQNPRPDATISQDSLAQLRDYTSTCEQCKVARASLEANVTSKTEQLKLAGEQLAAVQKERDAYRSAVKGTFWKKTDSALKYIVIGGGIGAAAICGTGHCK